RRYPIVALAVFAKTITRDVAAAAAGATPNAMRSTGTTTNPPPRPTSEPNTLAAVPTANRISASPAFIAANGAEASALDAPDVAAVARVDADHIARVHEERDLDRRPCLQLRRLRRAGRRVAFEAGIRLFDLQLDVRRKRGADRLAVVELDVDPHPVFEEVRGIADDVALQRDVLVRLVVHEVVAVGIVVEHLHLAVVDRCALQLLAGAERAFHRRARLDVLQPRPHEGGAFARLDVQEFDDGPELTVDHDRDAVAEIVRGDHGWLRLFSKKRRAKARRRLRGPVRFQEGQPVLRSA